MKTCRKRVSRKPEPELVIASMEELEEILERARGSLSEEDLSKLRNTVLSLEWLQQELQRKNVNLARLRSLFGLSTSEKTKDVLEGEPQHGPAEGSTGGEPRPKKKRKGHGRKGAQDYPGAERRKVDHGSLQPGAPCPECSPGKQGKVYEQRPRTLVRVVGQAPLKATVYELETLRCNLRCNLCGTVFAAEAPPGVGEKKYDATSASMIALLKYGSGLPFHRLERLQGNLGIPLPAATQWEIVRDAAREVEPVHEELMRQAAQGRLLHNDNTSMQVLALRKQIEQEERSGKAERTGIFSTSIVSELKDGHRVALFLTGRQHAGENLKDLLRRRSAAQGPPLQMCDGLDRNLPEEFETVLANCLAHGRRKFVEVVNSFPEECRVVLETLRDVYRHDATTRKQGMSDAERLRYHQAHSGPLMEGLKTWMREQIDEKRVEPNSSLGAAMAYMQKRWDKLTLFLREPGAPLDNNVAERALKKAILHRRNSLLYKTENGARVGDLFMGLIYSAELAGANAFEYLTALLEHVPDLRSAPDRWLPWTYQATLAEGEQQSRAPP